MISPFTGQNQHGDVLLHLTWQSVRVARSGLVALVLSRGCNASAKHQCIPEEKAYDQRQKKFLESC
jgi:hypothetical protein